jgi:HSP20 family protein
VEYLVKEAYDVRRQAEKNYPPVDVYERGGNVVVLVELPGIDPEDVLIKVYEDVLIIEGLKRQSRDEQKGVYICMEREFMSFRRILKIPSLVNPSEGTAGYRNGVIKIILPKVQNRVHKIKIEKE